ncbi:MAG: hypothetical protein JJ896_15240 [Rhodothermales bacterium]|nr:hypothetical protein [Rhodothermales bacterium]MBO6781008.1 hypothetical protein [Rhodothermales bacterium]
MTGLLCVCVIDARAQMRVDGSLFAQRFESRPVYGPGAGFHFSFFNYALELVASGGYYHTPADETESWNVRVDWRVNLPTGISPIRPYVGGGVDRTIDDGIRTTSGVAVAGFYLRLGDRIHPFGEAWYRAAPQLEDFRFRAGLRFQFLPPY